MRNLKRALSLALAMVMVMSMTLIGANAVSIDDFSDGADIVNAEAVTVLVTLGVLTGNDDGSFAPADTISRAEMSTIICRVLNGGKDPVLGESITNSYTDTASHWAKNYIEYCTTLGIVAGKGNGTFDPEGDVTVAEAAKMVLVALGYNAGVEGYTGGNWQINTDARANPLGLYDDLDYTTTSAALTRDNAAQMLYNALECREVFYDYIITGNVQDAITTKPQLNDTDKGTLLWEKFGAVRVEGVVVANEFSNMNASRNDPDKAPAGVNIGNALDDGKSTVVVTNYDADGDQFIFRDDDYTFNVSTGEDELGKTVYMFVKPGSGTSDNANRATVIGSAIISEDNVIVEDASGDTAADVADDNNLDIISGETQYIYNYGGMSYTAPAKDGVKGVQKTLIDTDSDGDVNYVLYREMRLGKVTLKTEADAGRLVVAVNGTTRGNYINDDKADIMGFDNVEKDDYVLTAYIGGRLHVQLAETVTGTIDAYKQKGAGTAASPYQNTGFTIDGEAYDVSYVDSYEGTDMTPAKDEVDKTILASEATFYMDENGYLIAYGDVDESAYKYAYVWGAEAGSRISTDKVKVTLENGTTDTYDLDSNSDIDVIDGNGDNTDNSTAAGSGTKALLEEDFMTGKVFSYTITSSGDIKLYLSKGGTVQTVGSGNHPTFDKGLTSIKFTAPLVDMLYMQPAGVNPDNVSTYYSNNATTFFYVETKVVNGETVVDDVVVYNGRNEAPSVDGSQGSAVLALNAKGDVGSAVFTDVSVSESAEDHLFVYGAGYVWQDYGDVDVILNGETASQTVHASIHQDGEIVHNPTVTDGIYLYKVDSDGNYELTRPTTQGYWKQGVVTRVYKNTSTFHVTLNDGTTEEFRLDNDSIVIDYATNNDKPVAVAGGSVTEGDVLEIIMNNTDDRVVLMAAIMDREDPTNVPTGPELSWDGTTQPEDTLRVYPSTSGDMVDNINEAFRTSDVYVRGNFIPDKDLIIPDGRALYVTGNVEDGAYYILNEGALYVGGSLKSGNDTMSDLNALTTSYLEVHGDWEDKGTSPVGVNGDVRVGGKVITTTNNANLEVGSSTNKDATLTATEIDVGSGSLIVWGHCEVNGYQATNGTNVTGDITAGSVEVYNNNSLVVSDTIIVTNTLTIGSAGDPGRVEAGKVDAANVVVTNGRLEVEGDLAASTSVTVTDGAVTAGSITDKAASLTVTVGAGTSLSVDGAVTANTVAVTDATLTAGTVKGNLVIESTTGNHVSVTVPTVDGKLTTDIKGTGNVSVATSAESSVEVAETITADTTLNGTVTLAENTKIAKDVTLTINGSVSGLANLTGDTGSRVLFGSAAKITDESLTNFVYDEDGDGEYETGDVQWFPGLGFSWETNRFVNDVYGMVYTVRETNEVTRDNTDAYKA